MRVVTVLRSGGDFKPEHVQALHGQIERWLPTVDHVCLTDLKTPGVPCEPLTYLWPGWWSKMNLFSPWVTGDVLFMDLDTVVVGPLDDIAGVGRLTVLSDFLRPHRMASGVMYLPQADRGEIWEAWMRDPHDVICNQKHGDQGFLGRFWTEKAARWQDLLPSQLLSYKAHISAESVVPEGTRLVAFHGKPRPWDLPKYHPLYKAAGY